MARDKKETAQSADRSPGRLSMSDFAKQLQKKLPDSNVHVMQEQGAEAGVDIPWWLPTGAPNLDWAMGNGIPGGRLIEIYSRATSEGKSSLSASIVAHAQRAGALVAFLDSENATLKRRMSKLGVDLNKLIYDAPDTLEDGFKLVAAIMEEASNLRLAEPVLIIWDSIGSAPTMEEEKNEYGDRSVGLQARVISASLKKMMPTLRHSSTTLICTNQVRSKIGGPAFGETLESVGGMAFKFYAHMRIEMKRIGWVKEGEDIIGINCIATLKKNKISDPQRKVPLQFFNKSGLNHVAAEIDAAVRLGILHTHAGGYYQVVGSDKKFRESAYEENRPDDMTELLQASMSEEMGLTAKAKPVIKKVEEISLAE